MTIKNYNYNSYLKALSDLNEETDIVKPKSRDNKYLKELEYINNHIERYYDKDGYFKKADFRTSAGINYTIYADGEIEKHKDGITKRLKSHIKDKTNYRVITVKSKVCDTDKSGGQQIYIHLIMMIAAYENFFDAYVSRRNLVVNHICICDPLTERLNSVDAVWNLEVIAQKQNIDHGKFIHKYGLYNVPIEAEDIYILKDYLIDIRDLMGKKKERVQKENRKKVIEYLYKVQRQRKGV
jgi:hypothetical protein